MASQANQPVNRYLCARSIVLIFLNSAPFAHSTQSLHQQIFGVAADSDGSFINAIGSEIIHHTLNADDDSDDPMQTKVAIYKVNKIKDAPTATICQLHWPHADPFVQSIERKVNVNKWRPRVMHRKSALLVTISVTIFVLSRLERLN